MKKIITFYLLTMIFTANVFSLYRLKQVNFSEEYKFDEVSSNGELLLTGYAKTEKNKKIKRHFYYKAGSNPMMIEPNEEIRILTPRILNRGIVAGSYKKKNDSQYVVRMFVFDSNTNEFTDLPAPCPLDWEIEEGRIIGLKDNGDLFVFNFLDRVHHYDYYIDDFGDYHDPHAHLFKHEVIHYSYNIHTGKYCYYLPEGVWTYDENQNLVKVKDDSIDPFPFNGRDYRDLVINDRGSVAGAVIPENRDSNEDRILCGFLRDSNKVMHQIPLYPDSVALNNNEVFLFTDSYTGSYIFSAKLGLINIGSFGGETIGTDLNDHDQVVGFGYPSFNACTGKRAFMWDMNHGMRDLNGLLENNPNGVTLIEALTIDNDGKIFVHGLEKDSNDSGLYLLIPQE